ncbi:DUF4153 domain-containing protein [Jannaschia donghaensis]|uniref:Uncharacterized protein n=1 Tax=Jannaschia donghaensis TaxID=420998 RepID=A0A0M6YCJ7_9RHOB|nr:DUF4173 domain-containing protein [Jannaschia donghaensis]CTQ48082.1 hypothetical protein JDO7802_00083 [Jannaschia donghaensis]
MSDTPTIRGLPARLARDGWWMADATPPPRRPPVAPGTVITRRGATAFGLLAVLVLAGDILFWRHTPGMSLAIFAGLIFAAAVAVRPPGVAAGRPALLLGLAMLPVVEYPQALSVTVLICGLCAALAWLDVSGARRILAAALHRLMWVPFAGMRDAWRTAVDGRMAELPRIGLRAVVTGWTVPVGGALILGALLVQSNPVFDGLSVDLSGLRVDAARGTLWLGLALLIWPFLTPSQVPDPIRPVPSRRPAIWNADAVRRALIVFNLLLLGQTGMDVAYLWTGAALPDGVTLAEYAHRGAYPLLVTALLAGGFAAAARPFLQARGLRPLLLIWLAQNIALTVAALLRLDLYVDGFGLTYLRLHAGVWMGVVALGLGLTAWHVARATSTRWLLARCATLGAATLYLAGFVNFGALIVAYNVGAGRDDRAYLCALPPVATVGAVDSVGLPLCQHARVRIDGWQGWHFRGHRAIVARTADDTKGALR